MNGEFTLLRPSSARRASRTSISFRDMIEGRIHDLHGIKRFTSTGVVTDDGKEVEADAVILCTGYHFDYSILSPEADPQLFPTPGWDDPSYHANGMSYPRLYQASFHLDQPDSLAFIGPYRGVTFLRHVQC